MYRWTEAITARNKHATVLRARNRRVHVDEGLLRATDPKAWHSGVESFLPEGS